jgi:hypothetical protein
LTKWQNPEVLLIGNSWQAKKEACVKGVFLKMEFAIKKSKRGTGGLDKPPAPQMWRR